MSALRRFAALLLLAFLALAPTGCFYSGVLTGLCTTGVDTMGHPIKDCSLTADFAFSSCKVCTTLTSDAGGTLPAWTANCPSGGISQYNGPVCCTVPYTSTPVCFYYNDPLLVELPSTWVPEGGKWKSDASPDSGYFIYTNAATMLTPDGGGPIKTDPGSSTWV